MAVTPQPMLPTVDIRKKGDRRVGYVGWFLVFLTSLYLWGFHYLSYWLLSQDIGLALENWLRVEQIVADNLYF